MLLAGDEFGNTQSGNNNAYAQDNELGWLDWSGLQSDPEFHEQVRALLNLRHELPHLAKEEYLHGRIRNDAGLHNIEWLNPSGNRMNFNQWHNDRTLTLLLPKMESASEDPPAVAIMFNASDQTVDFSLPAMGDHGGWKLVFYSAGAPNSQSGDRSWNLEKRSMACAVYTLTDAGERK